MQFKVPQDVQRADKIVGPLTIVQLIIVVVGGGIAYAVYTVLVRQGLPLIIWIIPVGIISLLTAAFAFLKIANIPFHRYLALLIERFVTPSKRVWVKGADRYSTEGIVAKSAKKEKEKKARQEAKDIIAQKVKGIKEIGKITDIIDTIKEEPEAEPLKKIDATEDKELIQEAFLGEKPTKEAAKAEKSTSKEEKEQKILDMSKAPEPAGPLPEEKIIKTDKVEEKPKKKRRRRRRRRRSNKPEQAVKTAPQATPTPTPTPPAQPQAMPPPPERGTANALEAKAETRPETKIETKSEAKVIPDAKPEPMPPPPERGPAKAGEAKIIPAPKDNPVTPPERPPLSDDDSEMAKKRGEFSKEELKKGQTIKFPTSNS